MLAARTNFTTPTAFTLRRAQQAQALRHIFEASGTIRLAINALPKIPPYGIFTADLHVLLTDSQSGHVADGNLRLLAHHILRTLTE